MVPVWEQEHGRGRRREPEEGRFKNRSKAEGGDENGRMSVDLIVCCDEYADSDDVL